MRVGWYAIVSMFSYLMICFARCGLRIDVNGNTREIAQMMHKGMPYVHSDFVPFFYREVWIDCDVQFCV